MAILIAENTLKPLSLVNTMSSTSNVQNLLTNVFRPTFVFDTTNGVYQTKLELTNVDSVSANIVYGFTAAFGDASGNLYVGISAGNAYSILESSLNTCNTFIGVFAGANSSSVKNGVFLGYRAGYSCQASSNSISIGANTINGGNSNIYIGCATGIASGSNNIFLGPGISNGGTAVSNRLMIGSGSNTAIVGDLSSNRVGINLSTLPMTTPNLTLDVNGFTRIGTNANGGLGINMLPGNYALDVTGAQRIQDGVGTLTFSNGIQTSTGGFSCINGTTGPIAAGFTLNIGLWKKGLVMIYAQDTSNGFSFTSQFSMVRFSSNFYTIDVMSSINSNATIFQNNNNIVLSNTGFSTRSYTYSITYFPSP